MKTTPSTAAAAPPRVQWMAAIQASSRKNVTWMRTAVPATSNSLIDQPMCQPLGDWQVGRNSAAYCANSGQIASDTRPAQYAPDRSRGYRALTRAAPSRRRATACATHARTAEGIQTGAPRRSAACHTQRGVVEEGAGERHAVGLARG